MSKQGQLQSTGSGRATWEETGQAVRPEVAGVQDPHSFLTRASRNKPASAQRADPEAGRLEGRVVSPRSEGERPTLQHQPGSKQGGKALSCPQGTRQMSPVSLWFQHAQA